MMITPNFIKDYIEIETGIDDIGINSRTRPLPDIRYVCWSLIKHFNPLLSLQSIGIIFNGRDHSTILAGIKKFNSQKDFPYYKDYKDLFENSKKHLEYIKKESALKARLKDFYRAKFIALVDKYRSLLRKKDQEIKQLKQQIELLTKNN